MDPGWHEGGNSYISFYSHGEKKIKALAKNTGGDFGWAHYSKAGNLSCQF